MGPGRVSARDPTHIAVPTVQEPLVAEPAEVLERIPEAAIQDAWVRGLFDPSRLRTTDGEPVTVVRRGALNRDSGPDVTGARVEIGGVLWAGDVEVHAASAVWDAHGHHRDPAYDRVVLHVVLSPDARTGTVRRADGSVVPELVLLPHLDRALRSLLRAFYLRPGTAPHCQARLDEVPQPLQADWVRRLGNQRLHARAAALADAYGQSPSLDRLLVLRAFRALGYEPNADAFETLAERLDLGRVRTMSAPEVHHLLLAESGLAEDSLFEAAPRARRPMRRHAWKRGGRPANAPTRRIAQAAGWLAPGGPLHLDPVAALADAVRSGAPATLGALRPPPTGRRPRRSARPAPPAFWSTPSCPSCSWTPTSATTATWSRPSWTCTGPCPPPPTASSASSPKSG